MYVPATTTPKTTWSDPSAATPNINPVPLDSSGEALIYGSGAYRQIIKDALGNTVWDALTAGLTGPFPAYGGVSTGSGNAQVVVSSSWTQVGGAQIVFKAGFANSGAATLTIGALGTFSLVKDGTAGPSALASGDIQVGNLVVATYDAISGNLHVAPIPFALPAVLPVAQGGTGASTAAGARASGGLNIDSLTTHGDSIYTIVATDRTVATSATLTAPRIWTLPAASALNAGQHLLVEDQFGGVAGANVISLARAGSDTINGGSASVKITSAFGALDLVSDGASKWTTTTLPSTLITPWISYTPTYTGFGSATNLGTRSRRVGSNLELQGAFTPGTNTATEARMTLGFAGTNGNVTVDSALPVKTIVGPLAFAAVFAGSGTMLAAASQGYVTLGIQSASFAGYNSANGNLFTNGSTISFTATIPIDGW